MPFPESLIKRSKLTTGRNPTASVEKMIPFTFAHGLISAFNLISKKEKINADA